MEFQINILIVAFLITAALGLVSLPILRKLKIGQMVRDDGPEAHLSKQGTPTMGGIIVLISAIFASIGAFVHYYIKEPEISKHLIPLIIVTLGFGLIGCIDDLKKILSKNTEGLKPLYKIIGLLIISVIYVFYLIKVLNLDLNTYIPFLKINFSIPIWIYIPFAIFIIIATTNAINLTDGIDGLATTVGVIIITTLTIIAMVLDVKEVIVFGSIMVGTCLGFLLFNLNPAKVFMGDTGSLAIGGAIGAMALYLKMPLILAVVAVVPIIETISVMMQVFYFKKTKKRIFKMAPIHHHFELSGWRENKVVVIFSAVTLLCCIISLFGI